MHHRNGSSGGTPARTRSRSVGPPVPGAGFPAPAPLRVEAPLDPLAQLRVNWSGIKVCRSVIGHTATWAVEHRSRLGRPFRC